MPELWDFITCLKQQGREKIIDFGHSEDDQALWVSMDFAQNADWTDMYLKPLSGILDHSARIRELRIKFKYVLKNRS